MLNLGVTGGRVYPFGVFQGPRMIWGFTLINNVEVKSPSTELQKSPRRKISKFNTEPTNRRFCAATVKINGQINYKVTTALVLKKLSYLKTETLRLNKAKLPFGIYDIKRSLKN